MSPYVSLQIKGVIEPFATEGAQVSLHLVVTLHVTVEHPLQAKAFAAQLTVMHRSIVAGACRELTDGNKTWSIQFWVDKSEQRTGAILSLHSEKVLTIKTQEKLNVIAKEKWVFIV